MNAEELIEEVEDIIQDPSYDSEAILKHLNRGQLAIANKLLLPGLSDGHASVNTVLSQNHATLPTNYHKALHVAQVDGLPVKVYNNKALMIADYGKLTTQTGAVIGVTVDSGELVYQRVPATATAVELFYYRKPTPMTESGTSFPDGLGGQMADNDDFDFALIHYACWRLFERIEQGLEGQKIDTGYHKNEFYERVGELRLFCKEGRSHPVPPITKGSWP